MTQQRRDLLAAALVAAALFLPGLGSRDLWNPDEPRYAEVAREMRLTGEYLVPHLNGQVYSHKPPLQFWAMAAAATVRGRLDETAARLPAACAAILCAMLLLDLGRRMFSRRVAWIAVTAFLTGSKILWQGRIGQIDMLLAGLVTLAVWCWWRALDGDRPAFATMGFAAAGLATLAKGPVGLLPPLLAILAFLAWQRDREGVRRLRIGRGLLVWAAVVLAWLLAAGLRGGSEYLYQIAFRQTVTRYADPWHHFQPPWYYLTALLADFFPWVLLLPCALVVGWRGLIGSDRRALRFAICWAVVTLIFFSVSPAKRTVYTLTMYPALALIVGAGLDRFAALWPRFRRGFVWPLGALAVLAAIGTFLVPRQLERRAAELAPLGPDLGPWAIALMATLVCTLAIGAILLHRGRIAAAVATLGSGMGALALVAVFAILPRFDAIKSARALSHELVTRAAPGEAYAFYPRLDATFLFYSERFAADVDGVDELEAFLASPQRVWLLARRDEWDKLQNRPQLIEVARDADVRQGYLLLTNIAPQRD